MAKVPSSVQTLPKISTGWVGRTNVTDDRMTTDDIQQTDVRATAYTKRELTFTLRNKIIPYTPLNNHPFCQIETYVLYVNIQKL